jgi:hypothetical protein
MPGDVPGQPAVNPRPDRLLPGPLAAGRPARIRARPVRPSVGRIPPTPVSIRSAFALAQAAPIPTAMALVPVPAAPVLVAAGSGQGDPPTCSPPGPAGRGRWGRGRGPDPPVRAGPMVGPAPPGSYGHDGSGREGRGSSGRTGRGRSAGRAARRGRRPACGPRPVPTSGAPLRGRGLGSGSRSREPPAGGLARPRPGGSTWMTPGTPRSGAGGSCCSATGWANDSTRSSLVATIAASDATPRATTTEALRRADTRGDPLRRRWTGG